jgi:hypothetical protein
VGQICLRDGDFGGHISEDAEVAVTQRVVHASAHVLNRGGRCANDVDDGGHFGVRTADGVDHRELANAKGSDNSPDAFYSRIAVGGVASVELVAVAYPVEAGRGDVRL